MKELISTIKTLPLKQRFLAFIIISFLISTPSIISSYTKTNDCKLISDQYLALVKNQANVMEINNNLLKQNNDLTIDMMKIHTILFKTDFNKKTVSTKENIVEKTVKNTSKIYVIDEGTVGLEKVLTKTNDKKIYQSKIIKQISHKQKNAIDSVMLISKKYSKNK